MKVFTDITQGSEEWLALRKGRPTASRFGDIITAAKGELSKSSKGYIRELIGECFCPEFQYWEGNKFTERGTLLEPDARAQFEQLTGKPVRTVGFVLADDGICGCSPDGLILDSFGEYCAGLELKCPTPKVHVGWMDEGILPLEHKIQVHGSMAVTGLTEWHFLSHFPNMRPFHILTQWDDYTEKLKDSLAVFVSEYKATRESLIPKLKL